MVYGEYVIGPQVDLAEKLASITPDNLNSVYFLNSGSEAIEGALKLVKKHTGRNKIVAFRNAYHGSTSGALSLMDNEYYSGAFKPLLPNIYFADYNDISSLDIIDYQTAGVFIEPVQGESGYKVAQPDFLSALREKCNQTGSLLVFDEIQCGMGRTGKMFCLEHAGISPDILVLAKGLGGGMPISCFISNRDTMLCLSDNPILGHITTFGGHPVSCAAALATINYIEEQDLLSSITEKEHLFRKRLSHEKIKGIHGKGLMLAVELENFEQTKDIIAKCYEKGLIMDWFLYKNNALRVTPPLTITMDEINMVCDIILGVIDELD